MVRQTLHIFRCGGGGGGERSLSGLRIMLYLRDVSVVEQSMEFVDVLGVFVDVYEGGLMLLELGGGGRGRRQSFCCQR